MVVGHGWKSKWPCWDHIRVRHGLTNGKSDYSNANVTNLDHQKWLEIMNVAPVENKKKKICVRSQARPGHADLVGERDESRLTIFSNSLESVLLPVKHLTRIHYVIFCVVITKLCSTAIFSVERGKCWLAICQLNNRDYNSRESNCCFRNGKKKQVNPRFRS